MQGWLQASSSALLSSSQLISRHGTGQEGVHISLGKFSEAGSNNLDFHRAQTLEPLESSAESGWALF